MGYYLKNEQGGLAPEKTYEFSSPGGMNGAPRQNGRKRYGSASDEAQRRIEYEKQNGRPYRAEGTNRAPARNTAVKNAGPGAGTGKSVGRPSAAGQSYRLSDQRNIRSGAGFEREATYQFSSPGVSPRGNVPKSRSAVRYVIDKNGRKVVVHSQAELMRIRRERELAIQNEQRRILEEARAARAEQNMRTVRAAHLSKMSAGFIAAAVLCTLMLSVMVLNLVLINERNHEISDLESELERVIAVKSDLQESLEKKNDLIYIEEYAVNRLGMVKSDRLSRQYISISTADRIELVNKEDGGSNVSDEAAEVVKSTLKSRFDAFWDKLN